MTSVVRRSRTEGKFAVNKIPLFVTGADHPTGLGVLRAVQSEGVDVYGLTADPNAGPCRSRLWKQVVAVADATDQAWLDALLDVGKAHGRLVLIPTQDELVKIVARNAGLLAAHYDFVLPPVETVQLLLDKTAFQVWASHRGFPVPQADVVTSQAELDALLERVRYPVLLKPFARTELWASRSPLHKIYRLNERRDVGELPFPPFDVADRYVVQQWISGRDSDVYFCLTYRDRTGQELAYQTGRKLLQWPVETGSTAVCTSTPVDALHQLANEVFDAAGLVGLGSLEVKRDVRDGQFYITEPTVGRPDLQSNVATAGGVNLTAIAYRDAVGLPFVAPTETARTALWVQEHDLPRALFTAVRTRRLDYRSLAAGVRNADAVAFAYYGRHDLIPLRQQARETITFRRRRDRIH